MTPEQELLSRAAKTAFRLNGQFYDIGEHLHGPQDSPRRRGRCSAPY